MHADALSYLPTNSQDLGSNKGEVKLLANQQIEPLPVMAEDIINTQKDPTLAKVYQFVLQGWPLETGRDLRVDRKVELSNVCFHQLSACSELDGNYAPSGIRYVGNAHNSSTWQYLSGSK